MEEEATSWRAFKFFGDETEQNIIGVAIVVFFARREDGRMFKRDGEPTSQGFTPTFA